MESFVLALALLAASGHETRPRQAEQYQYIVSIHRSSKAHNFLCAGSLVASAWVLTTANCLPKFACKVRYGDMASDENATFRRILKRVPHVNSRSVYGPVLTKNRLTPKTNNIGLAHIEEIPKWSLGHVSSIDYPALLGREVTVFEFIFLPSLKSKVYEMNKLRLRNDNKPLKKKFLFARFETDDYLDVKMLDVKTGVAMLCEGKTYAGPTLCVANKCFDIDESDPRTSIMSPDYGAPLVHADTIVGVTSEVDKTYAEFTPVSPYIDWIQLHISGKARRRFNTTRHKLI